ncbi:MAG: triphosphoribosyl-dephospho-CoA synthase [Fimbriiglobus sp.]
MGTMWTGSTFLKNTVFTACVWEATARKVGNVHPRAAFGDTEYLDFTFAAYFSSQVLCAAPLEPLGKVILGAVEFQQGQVRRNPNLGILLLLAPLATDRCHRGSPKELTASKLRDTTVQDAKHVYEAIRLAAPGGLGDAPEQDVRAEPTVTLLEAMRLAADRDMVARQYANGFADVFDFGTPAFLAAFARFGCVEAAVIDCQLRWMAEFPDSLCGRKNGPIVAGIVRDRAAEVLQLGGLATPEGRAARVALDKHLRTDGNRLNPGTTADLVTACLFVDLREDKVTPSAPFRWQVEDWL